MDILLFGIQGSGKGTQAKRLVEEFGFYYFEAGGELRAIAASDTELGKTVKSYIDEGHLVPHEIIMEVVKAAVQAQPSTQHILFDGIPRDEDQMNDFDAIMNELEREFIGVNIVLDRSAAEQRIAHRAVEQGRADDADIEKVKRRMDTFESKTMPVIGQYRASNQMLDVDGKGTIDEVYERIVSSL